MVISFKYIGTGIGNIKPGDNLKYDTDIRPLPGHLILAEINGELLVRRYQSTFRKEKETISIKGVILESIR